MWTRLLRQGRARINKLVDVITNCLDNDKSSFERSPQDVD